MGGEREVNEAAGNSTDSSTQENTWMLRNNEWCGIEYCSVEGRVGRVWKDVRENQDEKISTG